MTFAFSWSEYKGQLAWLPGATILLVRHGSHAYGLARPTSDRDVKGVAIPPRRYFTGFADRFEQAEAKDPDLVVFDVRKFFALAADCNPNIIEVLFVDDADVLEMTHAGELLRSHRRSFLSKAAKHRFSGYAMAQLHRINNHHQWLVAPPQRPPTRADFGLSDTLDAMPREQMRALNAAIMSEIDQWGGDVLQDLQESQRIAVKHRMADHLARMKLGSDEQFVATARAIGVDTNVLHLLKQEREHGKAVQRWDSYQVWLKDRNKDRAALEADHGYDTKHAMHLVRLMRMCREILTTGDVVVKRPDRDELLAIRDGAWSYDQLVAWAKEQDAELSALVATSTLPHHADRAALDTLCQYLVDATHG